MKLNAEPFDQILHGSKTAEIRLFDEKRSLINPGDQITFWKRPDLKETVTVNVVGLTRAENFQTLFQITPPVQAGWQEKDSPEKASKDMGRYYSPKEEEQHGQLAIHLKLIDSNK